MAPINWDSLGPRESSATKTKTDDLLARWKGIAERVTAEALSRPDDKEELDDDMRLWVRRWDDLVVEVEASQAVAQELGIEDQLSFGDAFRSICEALNYRNAWIARFEVVDAAKASMEAADEARAPETESTTDGDGVMMVDEDAVLSHRKKWKGREIPRKEQVKKSPVVEIVVRPRGQTMGCNDPPCNWCAERTLACMGGPGRGCEVCRGRHGSCSLAQKRASHKGVKTATFVTISDDEVEAKAVNKASTSTRLQRRKARDPLEEVEKDVLRLMEVENNFQRLGTEMLRSANELREWREEKYGRDWAYLHPASGLIRSVR